MSSRVEYFPVTKCFNITTGKLNSNAAIENGKYPFFTCAKELFHIDTHAFDQEALLLAGNNAQGQYDVKHYSGKFNAYQRTYVLTLANSEHSYDFYKYALQAQLEKLKHDSKGTNTKYITMEILERTFLPVPLPQEQKRIAAILDKADAIRRKRQQAIQLADDFLRSVFLDMFGDPVTNPKGWGVKELKKLTIKLGSGSTPRGGKEAYLEEGISLIRSLNIYDNKFVHKNLAFLSDEQAEKLKNVVIEKNDLLLNITGASVCRATLVDNKILPARVNQHVCIVRVKEDVILPTYIARLITAKSYKQKLMSIATAGGATREALTKQQVESLEIIVPPIELQKKFEMIVIQILDMLENAETQNKKPLFDSLSQKAFTGEL
ncbi:restriction endonuclease subunit S [Shewanella sp. SR44-3]|uniref:restriction endonuclease subunit S n=1 Tax=Shewanella sp. SR44-3 TaxID=2760936 RepID=UPI0015FD08FD|nr:restriction endonuclease subunit S [Shewanella sp. SR44-3]MBB1267912.1 restriction endonuclease subunit S [Shewanella sp. SR44-3]